MISAELFNKQLMSFPFSDTWVKLITKGGSLSETSRRVFQEHFILNISWATDFLWKIMLCFSIFRLAFRHPIPIFPFVNVALKYLFIFSKYVSWHIRDS